MSASAAREAARAAVTAVRERRAWARELVPDVVARAGLDERDAASAARLAYGVIESSGTLDEAIDERASRPRRVEPNVRDALQVAAYELLFTDTPPSAAVDQGVDLVRTVRPAATGLANAVLRRLADDAPTFPWGDPSHDVAALARRYAHPLWLAELLVRDLGAASAAAVLEADNSVAPLYLAVNPFRTTYDDAFAVLQAQGAEPVDGPLLGSLVAQEPAAAVRSSAVADGLVLVADAAAQLTCQLVPLSSGSTVLEIGSGRGTKTALLQARSVSLGGPSKIVAADVHAFKAEVLTARMAHLGVPGVLPVSVDATDTELLAKAVGSTVDGVVIDAPCSGIGTLRRHPEQRWRLTPSDIDALAHIGARLLAAASSLVNPGGFVVYSTCTLTRRENAEVIASFLESRAGRSFAVEPLSDEVPEAWGTGVTPEGFVQTLPTRGGPDGHFIARLRRTHG
jgi:16S rRNA (cytosine967-C5)-methyltransferase